MEIIEKKDGGTYYANNFYWYNTKSGHYSEAFSCRERLLASQYIMSSDTMVYSCSLASAKSIELFIDKTEELLEKKQRCGLTYYTAKSGGLLHVNLAPFWRNQRKFRLSFLFIAIRQGVKYSAKSNYMKILQGSPYLTNSFYAAEKFMQGHTYCVHTGSKFPGWVRLFARSNESVADYRKRIDKLLYDMETLYKRKADKIKAKIETKQKSIQEFKSKLDKQLADLKALEKELSEVSA